MYTAIDTLPGEKRPCEAATTVSVIIPASRLHKAAQALLPLCNQSYPGKIEIIVVGPPAAELARHWPIIALHPDPIYEPGRARNIGAAQATGEILLFLDDDMLVTHHWVEQNVRELQQPGIGVVGARMPGRSRSFFARCVDFTNCGYYQHGYGMDYPVGAGSLGIRRSLFRIVGGFDEIQRSGEDIDLCHRVQKLGYRSIYRPDILAIHDHQNTTLGKLLRYNYQHGRTGGLTTKIQHRDTRLKNRLLCAVRYPLLFFLAFPVIALLAAIQIIAINMHDHKNVLLYAPFIVLGKLSYEFGILVHLLRPPDPIQISVKDLQRKRNHVDRRKPMTGKPPVLECELVEQNWWREVQTRIRKKRFLFFRGLVASLPRPLAVLDVGGTQEFWEKMEFICDDVAVVLYNLFPIVTTCPGLSSRQGDARDMHEFGDRAFDIVFSNSVIEHVGSYEQQRQMADEVRRVGQRYCVQTPNRYFPVEPHVLLPFFQFLPFGLRVFILSHFRSPWGWKITSRQEAVNYLRNIRLLTEKELKSLFPEARIYKEKFLGMTKSFLVYYGW